MTFPEDNSYVALYPETTDRFSRGPKVSMPEPICPCGDENCTGDGVDYHNEIPVETQVQVKDSCTVEAIKNGELVGKAIRPSNGMPWNIIQIHGTQRIHVATVHTGSQERLSRAMVFACLKEL